MKVYEITNRNYSPLREDIQKILETNTPDLHPTGFFSTVGSAIYKGLVGFGYAMLIKPLWDWYWNCKTIEETYEKAGKTAEAKAQYDRDNNVQAGLLLSGLTAGLMVKIIFGSLWAFTRFLNIIPVVGPMITRNFDFFSAAAQAWILNKLASFEGRTAIAKLLTFNVFGQDVNPAVFGHLGIEAADYFKNLFYEAAGISHTPPTDNSQNARLALPNDNQSVQPTQQQDDDFLKDLFGTPQPTEKEQPTPNEYLGPRLQRNPTTGRIEQKPLQ